MSADARKRVLVSLPTRIPPLGVLGFASALLLLQLVSRTDPAFALLVFVFVCVSGLSFNVTGGCTTVAGFAIACMGLKTVVLSQIAKLVFWQAADSNLETPKATMLMFIVGFLSMTLGVMLVGPKKRAAVVRPVSGPRELLAGAITCAVIGSIGALYVLKYGIDTGTEEVARGGMLGLANLCLRALPMSIAFATAYTVTRSDGARSVSLAVVATFTLAFAFASAMGTKQGVFETGLYYFLACVAWRYRFGRGQLLGIGLAMVVGVLVIWPLIQSVKDIAALTTISSSEKIDLMRETLADIHSVDDFLETRDVITEAFTSERFAYYGKPKGWLDRFSMIEPADELVLVTLERGGTGWMSPEHAVRSLLPSFLDPNKPVIDTGNFYGHRIGYLTPFDEYTQVSFGILPESFATFSWTGVLVIPAFLLMIFVLVTERLSEGYLFNIWTVCLFGRFQHHFVEESMSTMLRELMLIPMLFVMVAVIIRFATAAAREVVPDAA
jgi:hypothetical protein